MVCCVYLAGATHNPNLYNKAVFYLLPGAGSKKHDTINVDYSTSARSIRLERQSRGP